MADNKLTTKQQLFIEAYLGEAKGNGTAAARIAGYKGNDKQLGVMASQNLAKPSIASRVRARVESAAMNANEVLQELALVAKLPHQDDPKSVQNKVRALELLGKHHKLFTDKVEHSGSIDINKVKAEVERLKAEGWTEEQALAIIQEAEPKTAEMLH
jgi:phage terminase small subunit